MRRLILILFIAAIFFSPLVILPFTIDYYHPPKELFSQLAVIFCLALWLMDSVNKRKLDIIPSKFYLLLLLFCAVSGLSLIWAKGKYVGLIDYFQILTYAGTFFICSNVVRRRKEALVLAKFAFIAGALSALYAIFQYFGLDFIRYAGANFSDWRLRLYSTFGSPDFLANYLIMVFPVGVFFYISADRFRERLLLLLTLVIVYSALLVTFSVGALLGLFFGILFAACLFVTEGLKFRNLMYRNRRIPHIGLGLAVLVILMELATLLFFVENKINPSSIPARAAASLAWRHGMDNRLTAYKAAYRMLKDNPIMGVGLGNFKLRFPEYRGRQIAAQQKYFDSATLDKERDRHLHSDVAQVWVETGVIGFVLFVSILIVMFRNGIFLFFDLFEYERKLFVLGLIGALTAFLIHSLVSFPMHITPNGLLFWTFAGLLFTQFTQQTKAPLILNIGHSEKRGYRIGIIVLAVGLAAWPVRIYLSQIFLKRMVMFDRQGLIPDAFVEAKTALFFDPNSDAIIYVGNYAALNNDYETAERSFTTALRNNDEINFHTGLAEVYYRNNFPLGCINEYKRALSLNPSSLSLHLRLAELYAENRLYDEAETECQFLLVRSSGDEKVIKRAEDIMNMIFKERFFSGYYGEVQANK